MKKYRNTNRKCAYIIFVITFMVFWMMYLILPPKPDVSDVQENAGYNGRVDLKQLIESWRSQTYQGNNASTQFEINSAKCKILKMDPFNLDILPFYKHKPYFKCSRKKLLTYVTKYDNVATLHINKLSVKEYSKSDVHCCYSNITRSSPYKHSRTPDAQIDISTCIKFDNEVRLYEDFVLVTCYDAHNKEIYKNAHAVVTINKKIEYKMDNFRNPNEKPLNVLLIGIDSISRMNMIRSMPKTLQYLQKNNWIEFKGYNKIGDNTFPNVMGILTGMNETAAYRKCNPKVVGALDKCNLIWYDYRNLGFITGYAEDESFIGTFNYNKKGFKFKPTDYYFRPYLLAAEEHLDVVDVDEMKYCTGPESEGERIMNLIKEYTSTFKDFPNFGFFWMNSFSHNLINAVSRMDVKIADFLKTLNETDIFDNSIVMFISDHGFRFGEFTFTHSGWLEERLPYFFMSMPNWFKENYPRKYKNILKNTKRLVSPFDVYMTLQDILVILGRNYEVSQSSACPKCKSLFEEVAEERSCADAGIQPHWCTCNGYLSIPSDALIVTEAAKFILSEIRKVQRNTGDNYNDCVDFKFQKTISAEISERNNKNVTYFLITFETLPKAVFQGTISVNVDEPFPSFKIEGSISRLDYYGTNSWCVQDSILKKYCYCHDTFTYAIHSLNRFVRYIF